MAKLYFKHIILDFNKSNKNATIWLNRPEVHNALNPPLIDDILRAFEWLETKKDILVIMIRGQGKSFCSGADIKWMKESGSADYTKSYKDTFKLASCFKTIYNSNKITINLVHGNVFGGALGFIGAADFTYALHDTRFGLPELKLGIVPSVISLYLLTRMTPWSFKKMMLTGVTLQAVDAQNVNLIDCICEDAEQMETKANELTASDNLSPDAMIEAKKLMRKLNGTILNNHNERYTFGLLTRLKMSDDAKERMSIFINKPTQ